MSQRKDPRSCKSQLRVWSTMIFHTVIVLQLTSDINGGESLANRQYRMLAVVGHTQNVTLPCSITPATDLVDEMVEWSRSDMNPRFVHVRRSGEDHLVDQNPAYKERTSLSVDTLKLGDASLTLAKVRLSDEGTYRCFIPGLKTDFSVELVVEADIKITKVSPGVLECKSKGWYPEPKVFWLEREQKLLSAGSKETFRGPDDLYNLSSRLTLEKGHSNNLTCRIQQNNQHREATINVPDYFFMESSSSARSAIGGLIAGIMFIIAVSFLMWKCSKNKMENKESSKDEESQSGREDPEKESLMKNEGGSEALMDQGKVKVNNPAYASEQPGLSSENEHDISNCPDQITQSERPQNNDQQGRDTTNVMCSNEKTHSVDEKSVLTEMQRHDSNNETPNQSLMDSSRQQQQIDTHMKEKTKNTQTISDEMASQSPSEEEGKKETKEENNSVEKKAIDGERPQTANNALNSNVLQPNPTEEGQGNREEDSGPNPNSQVPHKEENRTIQENSGTTEQPKTGEKQSENNSATDESSVGADQQEHSTASKNAKSGPGHQNNDVNGERKQTTDNETTVAPVGNVNEPNPAVAEEAEEGQDRGRNPDTQASHEEENRRIQEHAGTTEQLKTGEKQSENNSATDEGSVGADQQEHSTASKNAKSGPGHQNNDVNRERKQTTDNETKNPHDGIVSEPFSAVAEKAEIGQDNQEEDRGTNPDTLPSHLDENRRIQKHSGTTEQPKTGEKQSENNSSTDESSVGADQQKHSTALENAKSGPGDQNNDVNGERKQTTDNETTVEPVGNVNKSNSAVAEEAEEGQDRGTNPETSHQPNSPLEQAGQSDKP